MLKVVQPSREPLAAPQHVAIIMDGNGRWAKARSLPRTFGHREGVEALRRTVEAAGKLGISYLTVFGFSTEDWRRPPAEVDALFDLMRLYVARDLDRLVREGVRIRVIGGREELAPDVLDIIESAENRTAEGRNLQVTVAFNYGGRSEIVRAVRKAAAEAAAGRLDLAALTPEAFDGFLDTRDLPSPDLVIRTSGEHRISNFLLWQAAYAELVFLDVLWPDFNQQALEQAIEEYHRRERRYGGLAGEPGR